MENRATISADIVSFTALHEADRERLRRNLKGLLVELEKHYVAEGLMARLVGGDQIECAFRKPEKAMRMALLLKTRIKSFALSRRPSQQRRSKYFQEHGIRAAVAVAPLQHIDRSKDLIDGEAIYLSGRKIKQLSTSEKQKIIIKNTLFFCSDNADWNRTWGVVFALVDLLIAKCSAKQCEVLFLKLMEMDEKEISERLGRAQSTVSRHSTVAGWTAIEKAVQLFEEDFR